MPQQVVGSACNDRLALSIFHQLALTIQLGDRLHHHRIIARIRDNQLIPLAIQLDVRWIFLAAAVISNR